MAPAIDIKLAPFLISMGEIFRRSLWALIRMENEQVSNSEGFRVVHEVPHELHIEQENRFIEKVAAVLEDVVQHTHAPSLPSIRHSIDTGVANVLGPRWKSVSMKSSEPMAMELREANDT